MARKQASMPKSGSKTAPTGIPTGLDPMRDLHKLMEKQQFGSKEEIEAFLTQISQGPIPEFEPENDQEEAEVVYEAMELEGEDQKELIMDKDDASCAAHFNRVLYLFTKHGAGPQALQALQAARSRNKFVVPMLLKEEAPSFGGSGYTPDPKKRPSPIWTRPRWCGAEFPARRPGCSGWRGSEPSYQYGIASATGTLYGRTV
jgi:hypothetical protein